MIRRAHKKVFLLITAAAIMLACVPTFAPASTPIPTFDPNSVNTSIVQTANAAATQTMLYTTPSLTPTFTSTSTKTPSATPTPTNTFLYLVFSPTASITLTFTKPPTIEYACELISQSPEDNSLVGAGAFFSVRWQVKNTGTAVWNANNIDYRYKSGTKMHKQDVFDLYKNIAFGEVADIIVDMTAPTKPGKYSTTWKLRVGKTEFCTLTLTININ